MAPFTYQPLDVSQRQIRLLDLLSGSGIIQCHLRHVSLAMKEPYEALSYCWGVTTGEAKILVDGFVFLVTPNLHAALLHLRGQDAGYPRTLWVDAICIHQSDVSEKNTQIPLMRDIYMSCQRTVIWLGERDYLTRSAFEGVKFMASKADDGERFNYYEWRQEKRGGQPSGFFGRIRGVAESLQSVAAFNALFGRPWFTRVWVIQELALSPHAIVVCGDFQMDWSLIRRAHAITKTNFEVQNHLGTMLRFRNSPDDSANDMFCHMIMAWHKDSTNPKDKIYGLMGLPSTESAAVPIEVDYAADNVEVFVSFTRKYLGQTGNLQVLAICRGCKPSDPAGPVVPSWVIDHEYNRSEEPLPDHLISWSFENLKWSAGGNISCLPSLDGNLLGLRGFQFDSVTDISIDNVPAPAKVGASYVGSVIASIISAVAFSRFYLEAKKICLDANPSGVYSPTKQTSLDAFWSILRGQNYFTGQALGGARAKKECEDVDRFLTRLAHPVAMGRFMASLTLLAAYIIMLILSGIFGETQYIEFFGRIGITRQRRFFVTGSGYMGLGPRETKVGDKIMILQGHRAPIVGRAGQPWRVVGEGYVHGIMKGEAFEEKNCTLLWFG